MSNNDHGEWGAARPESGSIVVGVADDAPDSVVQRAIEFAVAFDAPLLFAAVDVGAYEVTASAFGDVVALPVDPDLPAAREPVFPPALEQRIAALAGSRGVRWTTTAVAGEPSQQLMAIADEVDAPLIVVGSRRRGAWGSVREFLNGSIAARLAHRQHRPVVIVPLAPVRDDSGLPWDGMAP